ncbi:uncharacterized protein LOC133178574 isoform X2 [Saccostrea echinata]|uniref:uncharacterized protein LOC133178574 isoform X2 n=1 Tax=Saccostrea echinata TaxID=191078 RepID=UPI002A7F8E2F|nr:uncharacterized protein LOC133178574 isoform X2 [Saccostrea echinata]
MRGKREVCNVTYFETGQKETWNYSVIYGFEFRYLGTTKLVEHKVWDGSSQFRPLVSDVSISNESPLSYVFRLEIEGITLKREGNTWIKNGLLKLKVEVTVTSKSARHLLPKQLMPDEPLSNAVPSSPQTAEEFLYNKLPEDEDTMNGKTLETTGCFMEEGLGTLNRDKKPDKEPLSNAVPSSPQTAEEFLYNKLPEDEDTMNGKTLETTGCFMEEGLGTLNRDKKPDKDLFKKKKENVEKMSERSKYGAVKSYEDFPSCYHRLSWLLQCLIAFTKVIIECFSIQTHSMLQVLVPILLLISRSTGEQCITEAALEVGNITILNPCETCDSHKVNLHCQGNNISVCLKIFPTSQFAVGCAPNICINDGCPEWNGGNGSYKIQYRNGGCSSICQGHFSLAEWIKNCTISPTPSLENNCLPTTSDENGSDSVVIVIVSFSIVAVGIVVGLLILWKKQLLCFRKNRANRDEIEQVGLNLNP